MPPKPLPRDRVNPPTNAIAATTGDWGHAMQGHITPNVFSAKRSFYKRMMSLSPVVNELAKPASDPQSNQEIHESIIAPSGDHIEAGIRKKSLEMVSSLLDETMPGTVIAPPPPNLFQPYVLGPCTQLYQYFEKWCDRFYPEVHERTVRARIRKTSPVFRLFMAYIQPLPQESYEHGRARAQFTREWMHLLEDAELQRIEKMPLLDVLSQLFQLWARCVTRLEELGHWGEAESSLRDDILQRSQFFKVLLEQGDTVQKLKLKELAEWNAVWSVGQGELYKTTHPYMRDIEEVLGELRCGERTVIKKARELRELEKRSKENKRQKKMMQRLEDEATMETTL
jgi:hypothetical protein